MNERWYAKILNIILNHWVKDYRKYSFFRMLHFLIRPLHLQITQMPNRCRTMYYSNIRPNLSLSCKDKLDQYFGMINEGEILILQTAGN